MRALLLLWTLTTLAACGRVKLEDCQQLSEFGRENLASCSYKGIGQEVRFGAEGELLAPVMPKAAKGKRELRVLFLGQTLVSGEFVAPGEELLTLLHGHLAKDAKDVKLLFDAAPVRGVGLRYYEEHFDRLVQRHKPDFIFTLIEPRMIAADYLMPRKAYDLCPLGLVRDFNNVMAAERIATPTSTALRSMISKAQAAKIELRHIWVAGGVSMVDMLADLEGCRWLLSFIDQKSIAAVDFETFQMVNELPVITSREFPIIFRTAVLHKGNGFEKTRLYYQQLSRTLAKMVGPALLEKRAQK